MLGVAGRLAVLFHVVLLGVILGASRLFVSGESFEEELKDKFLL